MTTCVLPAIEYPTLYTFRVIGHSAPDLRAHVLRLVQGVLSDVSDDSLTERPSRKGNYLALQVRCFLRTEEQRAEVYRRFQEDQRIVYVL